MAARILLVDDDPDCRHIYGEYLSLVGHRVVTAADGEEAVVYATRYPFDLVLLDIALPKLDGLRVLKAVRDHPVTQAIPVIVVSAGDHDMLRNALAAGADRVLEKPCLPNELEVAVRACLEREGARLRRETSDT